jgi:WhiB family transcriptional regulator, redox-sensing transcriptional regulator
MNGSACVGVDPEVFFGPADSPAGRPLFAWELRALRICAGCPVRLVCLEDALTVPALGVFGVVGGMAAGQRRVERARRQRESRAAAASAGVRR